MNVPRKNKCIGCSRLLGIGMGRFVLLMNSSFFCFLDTTIARVSDNFYIFSVFVFIVLLTFMLFVNLLIYFR